MQFVIMSGSVPPIAEPAIISAFGLLQDTVVIRTPTRRPELRLILNNRVKDTDDVVKLACQIYKTEVKDMAPEDRTLIYVPYINEGNKLAKLLECEIYKSELTDALKDSIYYSWINGEQKVMICTSAFSAGNDYPSVHLVIHAGSPLEMIGFIQEVSRGGRDKKPTKCIIIPCNRKVPNTDADPLDHKGWVAVWNMLFDSEECLRYCMTLYNDGRGIRCSDDEENQICSRCELSKGKGKNRAHFAMDSRKMSAAAAGIKRKTQSAFESAYQAAKMRRVEITAEEQEYVANFQRALTCYRATCVLCIVKDGTHDDHDFRSCPTLMSMFGNDDGTKGLFLYKSFKNKLHYDHTIHNPICYYCHVPICHNLLHEPVGTAVTCTYPDVVDCIGWTLYQGAGTRPLLQKEFSMNFNSIDSYTAWLNGSPIAGHKSNLSAVFL